MYFKKYFPKFIISFYHRLLVWLAAVVYRFPSNKMIVIGVTGTNGKSTTVQMIVRILEEAGFKVGSVSSIWYKIADQETSNPLHMTMPGRFRLQKLLSQMVRAGCQYAVLEVTSEGIKQHRHKGINFDVAVLTNLTPEHIEAHGSFEKYRQAKARLFASLSRLTRKEVREVFPERSEPRAGRGASAVEGFVDKVIVVNLDDKNAAYFLGFKADQGYGYTINSKCPIKNIKSKFKVKNLRLIKAENIEAKQSHSLFDIPKLKFQISLAGEFNVYNSLAAICVGLSQGVSFAKMKSALVKVKLVPGRMEFIQKQPFAVIVDLAHTPDAVKLVYQTCQKMLKPVGTGRRPVPTKIITVFGSAGGGRDKWKRPKLGKLAAQYCDIIIITNEDPYDEEPEKIIEDISSGISLDRRDTAMLRLYKTPDRRQAIRQALKLAQPNDIVLILGKGSEPNMVFANNKKIPWDDRQVVREELEKIEL